MSLGRFHNFNNGTRWRLTRDGIEVEGSGVERTRGAPRTVGRVWDSYCEIINDIASQYRVPCELIIATICTESSGNPRAVREEPGFRSDSATPSRISAGLMQTLISTASDTLRQSVSREWLFEPRNSIKAGTAYIAFQSRVTEFDPPRVAAAYNAGGVKRNNGARNRWKMKQYPIGTGEHCDRFIKFFNDAVYVLKHHSVAPSVTIMDLLNAPIESSGPEIREGNAIPPSTRNALNKSRAKIEIQFGPNAKKELVSTYSLGVLEDILVACNEHGAFITSTARKPADQARIMYDNCAKHGVAHMKGLYKGPGRKIIEVYEKGIARDLQRAEVIQQMERKINEIGPSTVSLHLADPKKFNVIDIDPKSLKDRVAFERVVAEEKRISKFLKPKEDPAYHLEIPQPITDREVA
ncbi:MAG: transglycosylase SLT domain-containing protein [Oligoflexia bacterium]|nr:transglycosylase SLT domain-containing protein [Oligoflexia bacterium]